MVLLTNSCGYPFLFNNNLICLISFDSNSGEQILCARWHKVLIRFIFLIKLQFDETRKHLNDL